MATIVSYQIIKNVIKKKGTMEKTSYECRVSESIDDESPS